MSLQPIAIASSHNDLHALIVRKILADRHGAVCHLLACDQLARTGKFEWTAGQETERFLVPTSDGGQIDVASLGLVWWRRASLPQVLPPDITDPAAVDVINNDCYTAWLGSMIASFRGRWISHPVATRFGEYKPIQLPVAHRAGLRIPRTLISQDPEAIRRFYDELGGEMIVKPVRGTRKAMLRAGRVRPEELASDEMLRCCPAIYQELIPGHRHLRVLMFGERALAALLESTELDWRGVEDVGYTAASIDGDLARKLRRVLDDLDLAMGVFDLKLTDEGEPVWLEVNPQGQFLFAEPMTGIDFKTEFADYLAAEASR